MAREFAGQRVAEGKTLQGRLVLGVTAAAVVVVAAAVTVLCPLPTCSEEMIAVQNA